MPEGPEVRAYADEIKARFLGSNIVAVRAAFAHLQLPHSALSDTKICRVETFGKAMTLCIDAQRALYVHLKLRGYWRFSQNTKRTMQRPRHWALSIQTSAGEMLLCQSKDVEWWGAKALHTHPYISQLGPDLLNDSTEIEEALLHLEADKFKNRRMESLLLDPRFLAGVGNYLRSELLFLTQIHPERLWSSVRPKARERMVRELRTMMQRSHKHGGCTLRAQDLKRIMASRRYQRHAPRHYVFDRKIKPCFVCGRAIERLWIAGRKLDCCPKCQPQNPHGCETKRA